jgi:CRP-like cAMP-binding protein
MDASEMQHRDVIARLAIFDGCAGTEIDQITAIAEEITVPAGTVLCRRADAGTTFYAVIEGHASVTIGDDYAGTIGPGGFFGEMALLDGGPRLADVAADTPMRLLVIDGRDFSEVLDRFPSVTRNMLVTMSRRLRRAEQLLHRSIGL